MIDLEKYPYYMTPVVEALRKSDPDSPESQRLRRILAANIGDRVAVRLITGIDPQEFSSFYPDMRKAAPDTMETIDSFLEKFGSDYPASGYMSSYSPERENVNFLIKNHHYEEALKIIEQRNLNNTEKNIYFADQMRFLRKLILIDSLKKQSQG